MNEETPQAIGPDERQAIARKATKPAWDKEDLEIEQKEVEETERRRIGSQ